MQTVRDAIAAAAAALATPAGEVSIVLTDDAAVQQAQPRLARHRQADQCAVVSGRQADVQGPPPLLGDMIIAYETLAREAAEEAKPFLHHLAHLAVHGFLHLLGYDHQTDSEADAMEGLERDILSAHANRRSLPRRTHRGDA